MCARENRCFQILVENASVGNGHGGSGADVHDHPNAFADYHVSADIKNVPVSSQATDAQLLALFEQDDGRQVLHVTFGKVLTSRNAEGEYIFRDRILNCLQAHEESHYSFLQRHFNRHLKPFLQ